MYHSDYKAKNGHHFGGTVVLDHQRIVHIHIILDNSIKPTSIKIAIGPYIVRSMYLICI